MERGDLVFVDTNILLAATDTARPEHSRARAVFENSVAAGVHLAISGQVLREYLVVATHPIASNGFGMQPQGAARNAQLFKQRTVFLEDTEAVSDRLHELVERYSLKGSRIHDANVSAVMETYRISRLVTQNVSDFKPFSNIDALSLAAFEAQLSA